VHLPGPAIATGDQVQVKDYPRLPDSGEFFITTLYQRPATAWWALRALLQGDWELVGADQSTPRSQSDSTVEAEHQTLRQLVYATCGLEPSLAITVLDVTPDSPLRGKVGAGDRLLKVQNIPIVQARQVRDIVRKEKPNTPLVLELVSRDGQNYTVQTEGGKIAGLRDGRGLGLLLSSHWDDSRLPEIAFRAGRYEGNSSDLMLGLDLCERLLRLNLRRGRRIAGSGGLAVDGQVTPVQGLTQKLSSARSVQAEIFFVPAHGSPALAAPPGIQVIPVRSLAEAIQTLQQPGPASSAARAVQGKAGSNGNKTTVITLFRPTESTIE
jgi:Lon-like protease